MLASILVVAPGPLVQKILVGILPSLPLKCCDAGYVKLLGHLLLNTEHSTMSVLHSPRQGLNF